MGDSPASEVLHRLIAAGVGSGQRVGVELASGVGVGLAAEVPGEHGVWWVATATPWTVVEQIESELRPRWTWWSNATAARLIEEGVRVATCWDVAAVHRLLFGGWKAEPARVWAMLNDLGVGSIPAMGQLDLLSAPLDHHDDHHHDLHDDHRDHHGDAHRDDDVEDPLQGDGHLRPEWTSGGWSNTPERLARWASVALAAAELQAAALDHRDQPQRAQSTARSESGAELLCAELAADGLPMDVAEAEAIIEGFLGPRPLTTAAADQARRRRDEEVLGLAGVGGGTDLRNPAHVRSMLDRVGVDVPDTRAWRLEAHRNSSPVVNALLKWRKAERIETTFGYSWVDQHVTTDRSNRSRLRGAWTGSDGAAGRMTAQAGLHNMPTDLRSAVAADPGHVFVRADLGQIEPRVLAAVSGDQLLAAATAADDMYAPVAVRLGVERAVAKVAVLAAMYGQTSGAAGQALRGMEDSYPVAMRYLRNADETGRAGGDVSTYGGRRVRMWTIDDDVVGDPATERSVLASRGRFARNAVVQGAAAELFKAWALTVRARSAARGARIVLCLHDELLIHVRVEHADGTADLVAECLNEASWRWSRGDPAAGAVRFVADIHVVERWSDAKT